MSNIRSFTETKSEYDTNYGGQNSFQAFLPIDQELSKSVQIKNVHNAPNEEYYKWQFLYSMVYSGLYPKDFIGTEVYFPKGNKNSAPIKLDAAIFDSQEWFDYYKNWRTDKNQEALDWLRLHLICAIEFKKEDARDIERVFNQQLKPAIKESESDYCLGILYDTERLFLFQKKNGVVIRLDESYNLKGDKSSTKELSLHLTDPYINLPSLDQLIQRINRPEFIDRSNRTLDELDRISGIHSKQINDAMSNILRTMDKHGMVNQRGYEVLIQIMAMKIFDEKRNEKNPSRHLDFYITRDEKEFGSLHDPVLQSFINRIEELFGEAQPAYYSILGSKSINLSNENHVKVLITVVEQFQDYSLVRSYKTDLYQLVFYRFANEFAKDQKAQFVTPLPLINFLVEIVNPRNGETVIDPTAGIADFLSLSYVNSNSKLDDNNIFGVDIDEQMIMLAELNMLLNGDGNANLFYKSDTGSITWKINHRNELVELIPNIHQSGNWDEWKDGTQLKKFDVVLTNPPFGEDRKFQPKTRREKEIIEMYELWHLARCGDWIDLGLVFLENAYRILKDNGRLGIVLSNSLASIERWEAARQWMLEKLRIVALFDLPANVFADTGVNTTLLVAYKAKPNQLSSLIAQDYSIFVRDIQRVGYEIRTSKRVKYFNPVYKINPDTFDVESDKEGHPLLDEEFSNTINDFRKWVLGQEKTLQDIFVGQK